MHKGSYKSLQRPHNNEAYKPTYKEVKVQDLEHPHKFFLRFNHEVF